MLRTFPKYGLFILLAGGLAASACGKKSSSAAPSPPAEDWDGLSDRNVSDLTLEDIDP